MEQIYQIIAAAVMDQAAKDNFFPLQIEGKGWRFNSTMVVRREGNKIKGITPIWWDTDIEGFNIAELIDVLKDDTDGACDN